MPALTPANDLVRERNVTASEVGCFLDKHPYSTPLTIYNRLQTPGPMLRVAQSEAMELGQFFEHTIARYAAKRTGLKLRANARTYEHGKISLAATPDYFVIGQPMLVEIKLSNKVYAWTEDTLQPYIEWQARAQMAVCNKEAVMIAALVGSTFHTVMVTRDREKERRMLAEVEAFWTNHVIPGIPPADSATQTRLTARVSA